MRKGWSKAAFIHPCREEIDENTSQEHPLHALLKRGDNIHWDTPNMKFLRAEQLLEGQLRTPILEMRANNE